MPTLDCVLVATDLSEHARHAVERAGLVGAAAGAKRGVVLHVIDSAWLEALRSLVTLPAEVEEALLSSAAAPARALAADVSGRTGFPLEASVRMGPVREAIAAEWAGCRLLVVGDKGIHPVRDVVIGSTGERLLRQARKPVLVVKRSPRGPYRRVFVAVDFSAHSETALGWAGRVAPGAQTCVAHVFLVPFEGTMAYAGVAETVVHEYRAKARRDAEARMEQLLAGAGRLDARRWIVHGEHAATRLVAMAAEFKADLVVAGRHGRSITEQLLLGSVTLRLLAECGCDVLVTQ